MSVMQKYYKVRSLPYPGLLHSFTFIAASLDLQAIVVEVIMFSNKEWKKILPIRVRAEEPVQGSGWAGGLGRAVLAVKNSFSTYHVPICRWNSAKIMLA